MYLTIATMVTYIIFIVLTIAPFFKVTKKFLEKELEETLLTIFVETMHEPDKNFYDCFSLGIGYVCYLVVGFLISLFAGWLFPLIIIVGLFTLLMYLTNNKKSKNNEKS